LCFKKCIYFVKCLMEEVFQNIFIQKDTTYAMKLLTLSSSVGRRDPTVSDLK
jgi:hypothetical protein